MPAMFILMSVIHSMTYKISFKALEGVLNHFNTSRVFSFIGNVMFLGSTATLGCIALLCTGGVRREH